MKYTGTPFGYDLPDDGPVDRPAYESTPKTVTGDLVKRKSLTGITVWVIDGVVVDPKSVKKVGSADS